jgi:hypothetical protein
MGYRGKVKEQEQARALRAQIRTLADIAQTLGVSKSSVSLWVRDVPYTPTLRLRGPHRHPHPAHEAKLRQIEELNRQGKARLGVLTDEAFFAAGVALYAGEGSKTDGEVRFSNSDPAMVRLFCAWFRRFFDVDETRMRGRLYLHQGLALSAAEAFWRRLRTFRPISSTSRTARFLIRASVETSTSTVASLSVTHVRERIAKSWVS